MAFGILPVSSINREETGLARLAAWLLVIALLGAAGARGAEEEKLPTGQEVLDRYITAIGGRAALAKLKNRSFAGKMDVVGTGFKGDILAYQARPNKMRVKIEVPQISTVEEGTDGNLVWETALNTGPRVIEGEERAIRLTAAAFDVLEYPKAFQKIECTAHEQVMLAEPAQPAAGESAGQEVKARVKRCYKLVLTPKDSDPFVEYYDSETGLLIKSVMSMKHQIGEITNETFFDDYKKVDGILMPHAASMVQLGVKTQLTYTEYKHNVELPKGIFDPPSDVKAIINAAKEAAEAEKKPETPATIPDPAPKPAENKPR